MTEEPLEKARKIALGIPKIELTSGVHIPALGFGVGTAFFNGARGDEATLDSVKMALESGVLHIDEAEMYKNESATGKALHAWFTETAVSRENIFVTGKVLGSIDGLEGFCENVEASCRNSIEQLCIGYFDLYLVHAPFQKGNVPFKCSLLEVWRQMEALVSKGLTKAIGVSNWRVKDLQEVFEHAAIKPCMNQIENHPHLRQPALIDYCEQNGIAIASFSGLKPLTDSGLLSKRLMAEVIPRIATARSKTPAQILQRWNYQSAPSGRKIVITTTQKPERLAEYLDAFDGSWELSDAEMAEISTAGDEHFHRASWGEKLDEV